MEAADTAEWLGELGSDLQGPMASCCFFRKATTFWATAGDSRVNYPSGEKGEAQLRAAPRAHSPTGQRDLLTPTLRGAVPPGTRVTVLEDAFHIKPVGRTCLIVGAALQVCGQLAGPAVIDDPGVCGTDGVCGGRRVGIYSACLEARAAEGEGHLVRGCVGKEAGAEDDTENENTVSRLCSSSATSSLSRNKPATQFLPLQKREHDHHTEGRI